MEDKQGGNCSTKKLIRKHWKLCYSKNMTEAYNLIPARLKLKAHRKARDYAMAVI